MTKNPISADVAIYNACPVLEWLGYQMQKGALDLFRYQDIIYAQRPDVLIETGTWLGGSALFFAGIMDAINHGIVITVDAAYSPARPIHPRIYYVRQNSVDPQTTALISENIRGGLRNIMVSLDSDHTKDHVLKELELYGAMVTVGNYLVVEDTNIHGHPIRPELPEGPWEAVHEWLPDHPEFVIDRDIQPPVTNAPEGWLRKVK